MASAEHLQERIAAIFAEAKDQGLNLRDVIPSDVQDHFHGVAAPHNAKSVIAGLEEDVKEMKEKNSGLQKQLKQAQQSIENIDIPDTHEQLQGEIAQAKRDVDFYCNLMKNAEIRASQYQRKWQEALQKQTAAEDVDKKIKRLEAELQDLRESKTMIVEEMNRMKDVYDELLDKDCALLAAKEQKRKELEDHFREREEEYGEDQKANTAIEEQLQEVVTSLDMIVVETANDLNASKARVREAEQLQSATFSEIKPLRLFYIHANNILQHYQRIFAQLLNVTQSDVAFPADLPNQLTSHLQAASDACEAFHIMRAVLTDEGLQQTEHHDQLTEMSQSAEQMLRSLRAMTNVIVPFLWALTRKPDIRTLIGFKFGILR